MNAAGAIGQRQRALSQEASSASGLNTGDPAAAVAERQEDLDAATGAAGCRLLTA